jgi:hypothetical protein
LEAGIEEAVQHRWRLLPAASDAVMWERGNRYQMERMT